MDNVVNMLDGPQLEHLHRVGMGSHAKLERQGSKGSKGCPTPVRQVHCPPGNRAEADKDGSDHHGLLSMVGSAGPAPGLEVPVLPVVPRDSTCGTTIPGLITPSRKPHEISQSLTWEKKPYWCFL